MNEDTKKSLQEAERLMKAVENTLQSAKLGIEELTVAADAKGNVCIFGLARSTEVIRRADEIARAVPGVKLLQSTIMVKPDGPHG